MRVKSRCKNKNNKKVLSLHGLHGLHGLHSLHGLHGLRFGVTGYIVRFVFNTSVIPNITYILHYNVISLSAFATVESFDKNFCKYKSNLRQVCFIFSQAIIYLCLIRSSFQNSWRLTVNI